MTKKIITIILCAAIVVASFFGLQELFKPKNINSPLERAFTGDYYKADKHNDVLVIGDCEVYENISPVSMYNATGLTSYIRGNAQQLAWQSYYMLEDALKYETPKVVIYSVTALRHGDRMNEAYNRMTLDDMKWSNTKVNAIKDSMLEDESMWDYALPLLRYHSRWNDLNGNDVTYMFKEDELTNYNGFQMIKGVEPYSGFTDPDPLGDYTLPETSMSYLDKIKDLCESKGIQLILIKSPNLDDPHWFDEWDQQIVDYSKKNNIPYLNCIKLQKKIGIDYSKDTYNGGKNLNVYGAEKLGKYLGNYITKDLKIQPSTKNDTTVKYWKDLVKRYNTDKAK